MLVPNLRQDADVWCSHTAGLRRYGWLRHDGRTFGEQELLDGSLNITTSVVSSLLYHEHC